MSYQQLYGRACAIAKPYLEKKFGDKVAMLWDIDAIDAVPELEQGDTIADQFARKSTSPQENPEDDGDDEELTPPQSDPAQKNLDSDPIPLTSPASDLALPLAWTGRPVDTPSPAA